MIERKINNIKETSQNSTGQGFVYLKNVDNNLFLDKSLFLEENSNENMKLDLVYKNDGDWIKQGEVVCRIKVGYVDFAFMLSPLDGVIQNIKKMWDNIENNDLVSIIHKKGEYKKENLEDGYKFIKYNYERYKDELKWNYKDGDYIKKGDVVFTEKYFKKREHIAEKSGFLDFDKTDNTLFFPIIYTIWENEQDLLKELSFIENESDINKIENEEICYVYLMVDTVNNFHKIGISNKPEYREKTLQSEKPSIELIIAKEYPIRKLAEAFEKALHNTYAKKRLRGEWFNLI